jgi:hypothetical protein
MRISTNFVTLAELYTPGTQTIRQVPVSEYRYCPKHEIGHSNARIGTDQALQPQAKDCAAAERNHTCVVPAWPFAPSNALVASVHCLAYDITPTYCPHR